MCVEDGRVGWGVSRGCGGWGGGLSRGERGGIECCYWQSNRISMYGFYLLLFPVQRMAGHTFCQSWYRGCVVSVVVPWVCVLSVVVPWMGTVHIYNRLKKRKKRRTNK